MSQYRFPNRCVLAWRASWWIRLMLWIRPMQVAMDFGYSRCDNVNLIYYKTFKNKVYIYGEVRR
jgi:hypothetical protein